MPFWPFNLRRRKTMNNMTSEPLVEKSGNLQKPSTPQSSAAQPSRASSTKRKRKSHQRSTDKAEMIEDKDAAGLLGKENIEGGFRRQESNDEITALPVKWKLEHSPHLRPVDSPRAQIPYNFHDHATSQTSVGEGASSRPTTLHSKRSTIIGTPVRRKSSKKRPDQRLREEEIRQMSATMPTLPKRAGEGPLKRDSYKRRTFTGSTKDADISLPPADEEAHPSKALQQNDWEVLHFWYNPRPKVRLSHVPAYDLQTPTDSSLPLPREISEKIKDKMPAAREPRRHKTVGDEADVLDSNDIRALLERDAKRKEKKDRDRQDRLERKLRTVDKSRRSSGKRRQDLDDKAIEAGVGPSQSRPAFSRGQSSVHPALREQPMFTDDEDVGLGIDQAQAGAVEDPFEDPVVTPLIEDKHFEQAQTPLETPFDDPPVIQMAREVRMSTAVTPPLSPVEPSRRRSSNLATLEQLASPFEVSAVAAIAPAPAAAVAVAPATASAAPLTASNSQTQRSGSESRDRRAGAWASFFKRNSMSKEARNPETSFANTSRESMSRQPVPLHLTTSRESRDTTFRHSSSGPPTRRGSKFREDLPDAPLSPPDSRVQSPELPPNAAAIAAAYTARHAAAQEETQAGAVADASGMRSDTPVSPIRGRGPTSASMASVDSEGSWLASGGSMKRASAQSGLSRGLGSLTRRTPEFNASFENLGETGDRDAEYLQRSAEAQRIAKPRTSISALPGASVEEDEAEDPMLVHDSVRRKPTLVHRDPAVRSREGLLSDFSAEDGPSDSAIKDESPDEDELGDGGARLENARSVDYGYRHARQVSAGSAKLLDVAPRRMSTTPASPTHPTPKIQE